MTADVLFQFNLLGVDFQIVSTEEAVFLEASSVDYRIKLNLPQPGPYNTSTATSTYDRRGETIISFQALLKIKDRAVIMAEVCITGEHWYWGSQDDAWHSEEPYTGTTYLFINMDEQSKNVVCQEVSETAIQTNLADSEWIKNLIAADSLLYREILESYHYSWEDGKEPEKNKSYYPQKGILLYSYKPENPKWRRPSPGSAFPEGWIEIHYVYLLETGQIVTVEQRSSSYCHKVSFFDDESGENIYTEMKVWTREDIEKEKEKIAKKLIKMI